MSVDILKVVNKNYRKLGKQKKNDKSDITYNLFKPIFSILKFQSDFLF